MKEAPFYLIKPGLFYHFNKPLLGIYSSTETYYNHYYKHVCLMKKLENGTCIHITQSESCKKMTVHRVFSFDNVLLLSMDLYDI